MHDVIRSAIRGRRRAAVVAGLALAALVGAIVAAPQPAEAFTRPTDETVIQAILRDTNQIRAENGLGPLRRNTSIDAVAASWSAQQAANGAMSHNPSFSTQIPAGWSRAGENVAYGYDPTTTTNGYLTVVNAWKESPGHLANIVGDYTDIGIGIAYGANGYPYYTQNFGKYGASIPPVTPVPAPVVPVTLRTNMLVKAPNDGSVYFMDGLARKVPIASFDVAAQFGVTGWTTVPASQLAAIATSPDVLRTTVTCGSSSYLASGGKLILLASGTYGLPTTTLTTESCAALAKSTQTVTGKVALRTPDGTIYVPDDGKLRGAASMGALVKFNGGTMPPWISTSVAGLAGIPIGANLLEPGMLVRSPSDATIYYIDGLSSKIPVGSFDTTSALGSAAWSYRDETTMQYYKSTGTTLSISVVCNGTHYVASGGTLVPVSDEVAAAFPVSTTLSSLNCASLPISSTIPAQDHAYFRTPDGTIYALEDGKLRPLTSMRALAAKSYGTTPVWIPEGLGALASLPVGADLLGPAALVRTANDATIWFIDGQSRRVPVSSFDITAQFGSNEWRTVSDQTLAAYPAGTLDPLSIAVRVAGQTYLAGSGVLYPVPASVIGSGLAITELTELAADMTPKGPAMTGDKVFLRTPDGSIYALQAGKLRPVASWGAMLAANNGTVPTWINTSAVALAKVPVGSTIK